MINISPTDIQLCAISEKKDCLISQLFSFATCDFGIIVKLLSKLCYQIAKQHATMTHFFFINLINLFQFRIK